MEKLSEYNWIDIFDLLSTKDIENAANSCENWRNIITTTPLLMQKLTLRIEFDIVKGRPWMKLPYQNLCLKRDYKGTQTYDRQRNKIDEFMKDIDQLTPVKKIFIDCINSVDVIKILKNFQNLTTLVVHRISGWDMQDDKKIDLPNLTHLKIEYEAIWLLAKIRCHKIEVIYAYGCWTQDRAKKFGSFLQTCDKLKHLTLAHFYTDEIMKIKSQLETFEIIDVYGTLPSSFLRFLKSQKSSLKNLSLDVTEFDDEIANFIYFKMNLDKLVDRRVYYRGQIQELTKVSVKNLTINSEDDNFEFFEKLFQCCEMLEVLDVILPEGKQLEFLGLLSNLPKLKFLKLRGGFLTEDEFQQITFKFNRLERLQIDLTDDQCVKLIRCCPNLTQIRTGNIFTKNDFENIFQDCSKIQEIYLTIYNATNEDVETFNDVGSKIKLKVETRSKDVIEKLKLCDAKNRLAVVDQNFNYEKYDPFEVSPRILSH